VAAARAALPRKFEKWRAKHAPRGLAAQIRKMACNARPARKDHAESKSLERDPIQNDRITL
jgi:hypothetical protein